MNIHEYQAKDLLKAYGIAAPPGAVAETAEAAEAATRELGGNRWAVKAQVHAGGRGKAGGIKLVASPEAAREAAAALLGSRLVTSQTGAEGKVVRRVYVEQATENVRELYLAALVDRSVGRVALIAAEEGGEDIEAVAARDPAKLHKLVIDPTAGFRDRPARELAGQLGLLGAQAEAAVQIMSGLYQAFLDQDASLIEINPLVATNDGLLRALDIKMIVDDNALFRHPKLEQLRDQEEVDPAELEAQRFELNYVKLDGNIGCMVNGAGLALATIDLLKQRGGDPADFMDVRPTANRDQVATGFKMLLDNPKVKAILVNVYGGGILRCDTVAEGIAAASREVGLRVPVIVRAAGTNMEMCQKILVGQGIPVSFARNMAEAAEMVVAAAKRGAA